LGFGGIGTVTGNTVGDDIWAPDVVTDPDDAAAGILVFGSSGITIASNTVNSTQFGISVDADSADHLSGDNNTIKTNKISTSEIFAGIDLCSSGNSVTGNFVTGSDESAIHFDDTCNGSSTGNSASGNTLNTACTAFLSGPGAAGNTTTMNTILNTLNVSVTGTNTCTHRGLPRRRHARVRPHAIRP
jgi:parallel beta-helix repeat protein